MEKPIRIKLTGTAVRVAGGKYIQVGEEMFAETELARRLIANNQAVEIKRGVKVSKL